MKRILLFVSLILVAAFWLLFFSPEEDRYHTFADELQELPPISSTEVIQEESIQASLLTPKPNSLIQSRRKTVRRVRSVASRKRDSRRQQAYQESADESWYQDTEYWPLGGYEPFFLSAEDIRRDFPSGVPREINVTRASTNYRFIHPNRQGTGKGRGKTLYVTDEETIDRYVERLRERSQASQRYQEFERRRWLPEQPEQMKEETEVSQLGEKLSSSSYEVLFHPGKTGDERSNAIQHPVDVFRRIAHLDFLLSRKASVGSEEPVITEIDPGNPEHQEILKKVAQLSRGLLSLGHGGWLEIQVAQDGRIFDRYGADFTVYENPFKIRDREYRRKYGDYFFELAEVEIATEGGGVLRFPCDRENPYREGSFCAGTIPITKGGNPFDISWLEQDEKLAAVSIVVADTGTNLHDARISREDAAGADIDAIHLLHAYQKP